MADVNPLYSAGGGGLGFSLSGGGAAPANAYDIYSQQMQQSAIKPMDPYAATSPYLQTDWKPIEAAEGVLGGTAETSAYVQAVQDLNNFVETNIAKGVDPTRPDIRNKDSITANNIYRNRLKRVQELAYRLQTQNVYEKKRMEGVIAGEIMPSAVRPPQSEFFRAPRAHEMSRYETLSPEGLDAQVRAFNTAHSQMRYENEDAYNRMLQEKEDLIKYINDKYQWKIGQGHPPQEAELWKSNQLAGIQGAEFDPKTDSVVVHKSIGDGKKDGDSYIFTDIHDELLGIGKEFDVKMNVAPKGASRSSVWNDVVGSSGYRLSSITPEEKKRVGLFTSGTDNVYVLAAKYEAAIDKTGTIDPMRAKVVQGGEKYNFNDWAGKDATAEGVDVPSTDATMAKSEPWQQQGLAAVGDATKDKKPSYEANLESVYVYRKSEEAGRGNVVRLVYNYNGTVIYEDYSLDAPGVRENLNQKFSTAHKYDYEREEGVDGAPAPGRSRDPLSVRE